ncbi:MAG: hypothetical protein OK454_01380, partial [Thaumarchaeota archaeon]|nr:hypothetical protein [Nitrososphaerota archaeon]
MAERLRLVQKLTGLSDEEVKTLSNTGGLPGEVADRMIENVVGGITIPLGVATHTGRKCLPEAGHIAGR